MIGGYISYVASAQKRTRGVINQASLKELFQVDRQGEYISANWDLSFPFLDILLLKNERYVLTNEKEKKTTGNNCVHLQNRKQTFILDGHTNSGGGGGGGAAHLPSGNARPV